MSSIDDALGLVGNLLQRGGNCLKRNRLISGSIQFDPSKTMQFSADTSAKHLAGIQTRNFCAGNRQEDCAANDGGIRNKHGVWFIPAKDGNSAVGKKPPAEFWNMKCFPRRRLFHAGDLTILEKLC